MTAPTPEEIADALALDIPDDLDTAPPLAIEDKPYANRALRRLGILDASEADLRADALAEHAEIDALVQPEHDRVEEFLNDRLHGIARARAWVEHGLEGWMRAVHAQDPKTVTVKVTAGELKLRDNPPRCVIADPVTVAKIIPEAVKPVEVQTAVEIPEGYRAESAKTESGDIVPGVVFLVPVAKRFDWSAK